MAENPTADSNVGLLTQSAEENNKISWKDLVAQFCGEEFQCITTQSATKSDAEKKIRSKEIADNISRSNEETQDDPIYGQLGNDARFIACDPNQKDVEKNLADLMLQDAGTDKKPDLVMCCFGGEDYFEMNDDLEKEFMDGIAQVANTERVWVLTTGLNRGVPNVVGRSLQRHQLLEENSSERTVIGLTGWESVSVYTRRLLISEVEFAKKAKNEQGNYFFRWVHVIGKKPVSDASSGRKLDNHHTHFLLFDSGSLLKQLDDDVRSDFVKAVRDKTECCIVTIIVEGGYNTLDVILNDLKNKRPVIIVEGSGRLANILGSLLANINKLPEPPDQEIKDCINQHSYPPLARPETYDENKTIERIKKVLGEKNRPYLHVFHLKKDEKKGESFIETIFRAVSKEYKGKKQEPEKLLRLAVSWNCIDGADEILKRKNINRFEFYDELFKQALLKNRPTFVDYILRQIYDPSQITQKNKIDETSPDVFNSPTTASEITAYFAVDLATNPASTTIEKHNITSNVSKRKNEVDEPCTIYATKFILHTLYQMKNIPVVKKCPPPKTLHELNKYYKEMTRLFPQPFYVAQDISKQSRRSYDNNDEHLWRPLFALNNTGNQYQRQKMLRDLFLWSVFVGYSNIATILLLHLKSRIGAALLATNIARFLSIHIDNLDTRSKFNEQAQEYEKYASECMRLCHTRNEETACQLLLREMPLFGNVTYMQLAVAGHVQLFINTPTVNQVLDQQWYGQLDNPNRGWSETCKLIITLLTFGLTANILDYREQKTNAKMMSNYEIGHNSDETRDEDNKHDRWEGIEEKPMKNASWFQKFKVFHHSPLVKVFYHWLVNAWFLLVFSYMMLYEMKSKDQKIHWTEIYVLITITAMWIEDVRKYLVYYYTGMLRCWSFKKVLIWMTYAIPHVLFYVGFALHQGAKYYPNLLSAARIVYALDLEIWYLCSLRFFSAIKLLGPKLIMIRHMIHDLVGFMCLIFVCITAYGVVSRALFMHDQIEFTVLSILTQVYYRPYWFLYSVADLEIEDLDNIITSNISTTNQVAEATATHVLLTFHMLFINILLLNLLIAVFNFAIQRVQDENAYHWRHQRYDLIEEYFEKPLFNFVPFSLIVYIGVLIQLCLPSCKTYRVFKRFCTPASDYIWSEFENAATYRYARTLVENNSRFMRASEKEAEMISTILNPIQKLASISEHEKLDKKSSEARSSISFAPLNL